MTADAEVSYLWRESPVAEHLEIVKVHGFLICPDTGRALVQEYDGRFSFNGVRVGSLSV